MLSLSSDRGGGSCRAVFTRLLSPSQPQSVTFLLLFGKGYKREKHLRSYLKVIQKHARNFCLIGAGVTPSWGMSKVWCGRQRWEDEKALRQLAVEPEVKGLWVEAEARRLMGMSVCQNGIYLRSSRYTRWSAHCRWSRSGKYLLWLWGVRCVDVQRLRGAMGRWPRGS